MKVFSRLKMEARYSLDAQGCFVIENYNHSKAFSNFFPGVAGLWGIPMWVFYVNRGQAISSFGIESKDKAILEFQPANKAYRLTSAQGFRTFVKITQATKVYIWEPFQNGVITSPYITRQRMLVNSHDLTIEDVNQTLGLKLRVNYFTMPEENYPALVRSLTLENSSKKKYEIEIIDGLPAFIPYGMSDWALKNMSRTAEAWVRVENLENKVPYFHLDVDMADSSRVKHIKEGNFYFSFDATGKTPKLLDMVVEPQIIFGNSADFRTPETFVQEKHFNVPQVQYVSNRTPCAMSFSRFSLPVKGERTLVSLIGHVHSQDGLKKIVRQATAKGFIPNKAAQNKDIIGRIKNFTFTNSASTGFNLYSSQTFLDNVMRGGLPVSLDVAGGSVAFNVFSRKHGDPERDYNYFVLAPTPYSQGNGNYRDVNQNRRSDVWFNGDVRDSNIIDFLNLIQADGYNPLVVKGMIFVISDPSKIETVIKNCVKTNPEILRQRLQTGFQPGELLLFLAHKNIGLKVSAPEFLSFVLGFCHQQVLADHGEGFWSDHWTYNLDLVESFLALYPEQLRTLLLEKKVFSFYHNSHYVLPRDQRYFLTPVGVRQYHAVKNGKKEIRAEEKGNKLRVKNGQGDVYTTNLIVKLLCLVANKAATFDPSGVGIEMEADKPNWYDALNGLPGLLGSSISETLELKRFCRFLLTALNQLGLDDGYQVAIFEELADFIRELKEILSRETEPLPFWRRANDVKEHYRSRVRMGIAGEEHKIMVGEIKDFLRLIVDRSEQGVNKAKDKRGLLATYFYHEVMDYQILDKGYEEHPFVVPTSFKQRSLPLFLEGFVHLLRAQEDGSQAKNVFESLRQSELFDRKLKMYKVNADLSAESDDIGRARVFPAGWLENESIWLHMEYKYMLELLRCGLHEEFFTTFKDALIPFLGPEQYGRSNLENSSFIVSSAHEDATLHGQGFVARLSGSTAEFLQMWLWLNVGKKPFSWDGQKGLCLTFNPSLPAWLFTEKATTIQILDKKDNWKTVALGKNTYAFNFLGSILTVYHNPRRRDIFGGIDMREMILTYPHKKKPVKISGAVIPAPYSQDVRDRKVERIDVYFE